RYKLLFRNVGDWGCGERSEDYSVKRFAKDLSFEFSKIALNNGYSLFDPFIIPTNNLACYAQKKNSYVIDTEGNLLKCTVMLYDECNKIGNLQERKINKIRENLWLNNFESLSGKCYQCPLILICKGGFCPKLKVFKSRTHNICLEMQQMIMNNFELRILSDDFDYTLKGRDDG
ncbi:SPASM domain-containing protein, partial [uncultured Streptococcus sp.]|uniref:SPASM domain-containing protein n=1 Tax=uncultured Streptococcus sp. TaxID=83427 RepID=UPI00265F3C12